MQKEHENERRSASAESALRYMQSFMRSFRIAPECSQVQMATLIITHHLVYTRNGEPLSTWGLTNIEGSLHDSICVLALSEVWGKHPWGFESRGVAMLAAPGERHCILCTCGQPILVRILIFSGCVRTHKRENWECGTVLNEVAVALARRHYGAAMRLPLLARWPNGTSGQTSTDLLVSLWTFIMIQFPGNLIRSRLYLTQR